MTAGEKKGGEPVSLASVAAGVVDEMADGTSDTLDGTDFTKIKFVGMSADLVEESIKIGSEVTFTVKSRCVGIGEEELADGHIRDFRKMHVVSVVVAK
jgi:hypothetical protein